MEDNSELIEKIYGHCLGEAGPSQSLLENGKFPNNWVNTYLSLVRKANDIWGESQIMPRKVVASIHFSSFYLNIRYDAWRSGSGQRNENTEKQLGQIRAPSEIFLLGNLK